MLLTDDESVEDWFQVISVVKEVFPGCNVGMYNV